MDKIAKVRQEIERQQKSLNNATGDYAEGRRSELDNLLSFIDSLPDEPVSKDLEEAARNYTDSSDWSIGENLEHIDRAFIAGAKWQNEQDQPITGNSLEQEWLRYVDRKKKEYGGELPSLGEYGWLQIARHFAKWGAEHLKK